MLLLHLWLLGSMPRTAGPGWREEPAKAVQIRRVVHPAVRPPTDMPTPVATTNAAVVAPKSALPGSRAQASLSSADPSNEVRIPAVPGPTTPATPPAVATARHAGAAAQRDSEPELPPAEAGADPGGQNVPVYETRVPPAQTLVYDLRRGNAIGRAELDWRPSDTHYQLTMQGHAVGAPLLAWTSLGGLDSTGLAPLRHTESRRGRDLRAVNFQRDAGRVTFSGPPIEYPLVPGGQDRLSWMVQLAAVMAANPGLAQAQAQVSIWVVGTRGDADVWTFTVQDRSALDLPWGRVDNTIHLVREPRRPYDTQVQVWLDPARHHLPVQAFLMVRASGVGTEFRLRDLK